MNNMTEKIIKEGSHKKKSQYNKISAILGIQSFLFGFILLVIKGLSVEYIDAQGVLHENFFLIPIGFLFIFIGLILLLTILIRFIYKKIKQSLK